MWIREPVFLIDIIPNINDIDELGHVNNAVYVRWLEQCARQHSNQLGLTLSVFQQLDRAMAVIRHEIDYLASSYSGNLLQMATWITDMDKLRVTRQFQLINQQTGQTILQAQTVFCCIQMTTGKPKRMPQKLVMCYEPALTR
ncbi:acyl-CoA thioesterase [Entomomonas moraniae]|uniref:Acyl-CoA thioesterase n=1 Tax=Entomomonas moraniae TaxID=2213226 RepID=A0A3Q9JMM7_9GAMM|nr:acyl-CoA thioesterase [Entomomonas moraniae]AZS51763.1 acyl-CoA thioesterase [Entomomonas moraniae]